MKWPNKKVTILSAGELLEMFPPRTEAPCAEKLALCYAPHVDMTTVIEVEVRICPKQKTYFDSNTFHVFRFSHFYSNLNFDRSR